MEIMEPMKTELSAWLHKKFLEWQTERGESKDIQDFAAYIGVSSGAMSNWLNGRRVNMTLKMASRFAEKLGPEIYEVLGVRLPDTDPHYVRLKELYSQLPRDKQLALLEKAEAYTVEREGKKKGAKLVESSR